MSSRTTPFIVRILVACPSAFEVTVTVFVNGPTLSVAYCTPITPLAPGAIGSFGEVGTVHPHEPCVFVIINGLVPLLVKTNSRFPLALCAIVP